MALPRLDFPEGLNDLCEMTHARYDHQNAYVLVFRFFKYIAFHQATVTIRVEFDDEQSGADMVITNMTTFPVLERCRGFGTEALKKLLSWAKDRGLANIQAVQVQEPAESFWEKNGFRKIGNDTNDFRYMPAAS